MATAAVGANASSSTHFLVPYRVLLIIAKSFTVGGGMAGRGSGWTSAFAVLDPRSAFAAPLSSRLFDEGSIRRGRSMVASGYQSWHHGATLRAGCARWRSAAQCLSSLARLSSRYAH